MVGEEEWVLISGGGGYACVINNRLLFLNELIRNELIVRVTKSINYQRSLFHLMVFNSALLNDMIRLVHNVI